MKNEPSLITNSIEHHRKIINDLDAQIVSLLNRRATEVFAIGKIKKEAGLAVHDPKRESLVLQKIRDLQMKSNDTPLTKDEMVNIYFKIIDSFRSYEEVHNRGHESIQENEQGTKTFTKNLNVVFWGFGLMSGSFFLALQEHFPHWNFTACDPFIQENEFQQWTTERNANIKWLNTQEVPESDILILGAPVKEIMQFIRSGKFKNAKVVIDLGSVKGPILSEVEAYFKTENTNSLNSKTESKVLFVGGHPLAGKEKSGYKHSDATLFYNKVFILNKEAHEVMQLVKVIGAIPFVVSADTHDRTLAASSHLLQILSTLLAIQFSESEIDQNLCLLPGYSREVLRVSGSAFSMWEPIFTANKKNIVDEISKLTVALDKTKKWIEEGNMTGMRSLFEKANQFYKKIQETKLF